MNKDITKTTNKTRAKRTRKTVEPVKPVEDIQNRVRNRLSPFKVAADLIKDICDDNKKDVLIAYLKEANFSEILNKQIDWFIRMGATLDLYINDPSFDIEKEMNKYTFEKIKKN